MGYILIKCPKCGTINTKITCKCGTTVIFDFEGGRKMARKFLGIVERENMRGVPYYISQDESDPENKTMVSCRGKKLSIPMEMEAFLQCWFNWQMRGMMVQDAFRDIHASYREFLITGYTPQEWKEIFNETE